MEGVIERVIVGLILNVKDLEYVGELLTEGVALLL